MKVTCEECGREFNFFNENQADELLTGHDCEVY